MRIDESSRRGSTLCVWQLLDMLLLILDYVFFCCISLMVFTEVDLVLQNINLMTRQQHYSTSQFVVVMSLYSTLTCLFSRRFILRDYQGMLKSHLFQFLLVKHTTKTVYQERQKQSVCQTKFFSFIFCKNELGNVIFLGCYIGSHSIDLCNILHMTLHFALNLSSLQLVQFYVKKKK